ncbi:MAG: integrase, partial [Flavobacteriales bacterium]|nr:integrase [Flavobacteriales bacterium]
MYIDDFIDYVKSEKRYSDHTVLSYITDLNQFFRFLHKEYQIIDPKIVK